MSSNNYPLFSSAYPNYNTGKLADGCIYDQDCQDGLRCIPSSYGVGSCRPNVPFDLSMRSMRTPDDRNCHIKLYNGTKVYVPEQACGARSQVHLTTGNKTSSCSGCQRVDHYQTKTSHCIRQTNDGDILKCNPLCCDRPGQLELEWMKWDRSPQFYGTFNRS